MSRSRPIILDRQANRDTAAQWCRTAPKGTVIEFRAPKRSDAQNSALWGLLGQIQRQRPTHNGVPMTPELWKAVFMQAWGAEVTIFPTLDGTGFFPMGMRSSKLTKAEMADLLTFILAWCAQAGLTIEHFDDAPNQTEAA